MRITSYDVLLDGNKIKLSDAQGRNYAGELLTNPGSIVRMMNDIFNLDKMSDEYLYLLVTDAKGRSASVFLIGKGTTDSCVTTPKEVLMRVLLTGRKRFVLIHNHPSGDPTPSEEDILLTKRIKEAAMIVGLELLDHIVVGDPVWYSLKEAGKT